MSGLSRSVKSPSYLTPSWRPPMPGRTISTSSERSIASDEHSEPATSARSTPAQAHQSRSNRWGNPRRHRQPSRSPGSATKSIDLASSARESTSSLSSTSRPISIEIPQVKKVNSGSVYTPPAPLSARGDLPGGYFPHHEDPKDRVHRPHPFQSVAHNSRKPFDGDANSAERHSGGCPGSTGTMNTANIPITSYFPTGHQDHTLALGKYYPSNYESTHGPGSRTSSASPTSPTSPKSPGMSNLPNQGQFAAADLEMRRMVQLQAYNRDMVARASRAQSEIISSTPNGQDQVPRSAVRNLLVPGMEGRFATASGHKPNAPRLHPLGSPGPVTPMELETESADGSFLDKGQSGGSLSGIRPPGENINHTRST